MLKINISQIQPISSLPRNYNFFIKQAEKEGAVVFLKRNKPTVVLLDFSSWQEFEKLRIEREEKEALTTIEQSEKEFKQRQAKKLKSLKEI